MDKFDYTTAAELFPAKSKKSSKRVGYRRFDNAADAVRYAIEELPPELLLGTYLQVEELRFDRDGIRRLYEAADYPLDRPVRA